MIQKPPAFLVRPCHTVVISGVDLQDGDKFIVHRVVDSECEIDNARDIPYSPAGNVVALDSTHNPIKIDMPGRYRLYPDGIVSATASTWIDDFVSCE